MRVSAESRQWVCGGRRSSRKTEGSDLAKVKWVVRRTKEKGGWATGVWAENVDRKRFSTGGLDGKMQAGWGLGLPWHRRILNGSSSYLLGAREYHGGSMWLPQQAASLFLFSQQDALLI